MSTKGRIALIILIILLAITIAYLIWPKSENTGIGITPGNNSAISASIIKLPNPEIGTSVSVEEAIQKRRSVRRYTNESISLQDVSQILWAAQGITDTSTNFRAAPSAGHTYPLEVYILVGKNGVSGLSEGVYHYVPSTHSLEKILDKDVRSDLSQAANGQPWVKEAPVNIIITGNYQKMMDKYKDKTLSTRFTDMEAGHVGQNIYLEVEARNLATVALGSFKDDQVHSILHIPESETTLYIFPVGHSGL